MAGTDKDKGLKSSLKNTRAKLKRREERIAKLEARIAELETEAKKKADGHVTDQALRNITREYRGIISRNSSSGTPSCSDAKQIQALETLSRLLKD